MIYVLEVDFIVQQKEGSGTVLTIEDIVNALQNQGHEVENVHNPLEEKPTKCRLFVKPPRHIVTGEDTRLEMEEKGNS